MFRSQFSLDTLYVAWGDFAYSFAGFVKSLFVFVSDDFWSFIGLFVCCFRLHCT